MLPCAGKMGAVLGRAGCNIKLIQDQSGARVKKMGEGDGGKLIIQGASYVLTFLSLTHLTPSFALCIGTAEQISAARALIKEYVQYGGPKPETTVEVHLTRCALSIYSPYNI
jgi:hypothetical protein